MKHSLAIIEVIYRGGAADDWLVVWDCPACHERQALPVETRSAGREVRREIAHERRCGACQARTATAPVGMVWPPKRGDFPLLRSAVTEAAGEGVGPALYRTLQEKLGDRTDARLLGRDVKVPE